MKKTKKKIRAAEKPLTLLEESFIGAYITNGGNGAAAVKTAGYKCKAKGAAAVTAARLLIRANVSQEISRRREALRKAADVTALEVVQTLALQMRGDITELLDEAGSFDLVEVRKRKLGRLIKTLAFEQGLRGRTYVSRLQLHSAQSAANQLCKVLGINQEPGKNKKDLEYLKTLLEERVLLSIEGFRRGGISLSRRDILEMYVMTPESSGDLMPLIQAELASESLQ